MNEVKRMLSSMRMGAIQAGTNSPSKARFRNLLNFFIHVNASRKLCWCDPYSKRHMYTVNDNETRFVQTLSTEKQGIVSSGFHHLETLILSSVSDSRWESNAWDMSGPAQRKVVQFNDSIDCGRNSLTKFARKSAGGSK